MNSTVGTESAPEGLWPGDLGTLTFNSRRALVSLIKGPLITSQKHPELWNAVVSDTDALQRWLADILDRKSVV